MYARLRQERIGYIMNFYDNRKRQFMLKIAFAGYGFIIGICRDRADFCNMIAGGIVSCTKKYVMKVARLILGICKKYLQRRRVASLLACFAPEG